MSEHINSPFNYTTFIKNPRTAPVAITIIILNLMNLLHAPGSFSPRSVNPPANVKFKRPYHMAVKSHFHQVILRPRSSAHKGAPAIIKAYKSPIMIQKTGLKKGEYMIIILLLSTMSYPRQTTLR